MTNNKKPQRQATRKELLGTYIEIEGVRWYTYMQLAAIYNVTPQTIYNWNKAGRLETINSLGLGLTLYRMKSDGCER